MPQCKCCHKNAMAPYTVTHKRRCKEDIEQVGSDLDYQEWREYIATATITTDLTTASPQRNVSIPVLLSLLYYLILELPLEQHFLMFHRSRSTIKKPVIVSQQTHNLRTMRTIRLEGSNTQKYSFYLYYVSSFLCSFLRHHPPKQIILILGWLTSNQHMGRWPFPTTACVSRKAGVWSQWDKVTAI